MKKVVRLTESEFVGLVNRIVKESSPFTFGDRVRNKLGKLVGIPETSEEEERLASEILSVVESGDYEVLDKYGSGAKIKVNLPDGEYIVRPKKYKIGIEGGTITSTFVEKPNGEKVEISGKGFSKKLLELIGKHPDSEKFKQPDLPKQKFKGKVGSVYY